MIPHLRAGLCLAGVMTYALAAQADPGASAGPFAVRALTDGWVIHYVQPRLATSSVMVDGTPHILFLPAPSTAAPDSGAPSLPIEQFSLGIPFGADVSVQLLNPEYGEIAGQDVAPVPRPAASGGGHILRYVKDRVAYAANRFYPARQVWCDPPFVLRQQRIVTVHLAGALYNPARKTLRYLTRGDLAVHLNAHAQAAPLLRPAVRSDRLFEGAYRQLLLNYDQAKQWRAVAAAPAAPPDSTRAWFTPGGVYYRIPIAADGWYRVTAAAIAAAGGQPGAFDAGVPALWYHGRPVPLVVRPDSSVEFRGLRNRGDSTYIDYYTDTSSYWLTWDGAPGARYSSPAVAGGTAGPAIVSARTTVHAEQNTALYQGTDESELTNSGAIPGKGWVWEFYYPGTQATHGFTVDSIDRSVATAAIRVRLFSMIRSSARSRSTAGRWGSSPRRSPPACLSTAPMS